MSKTRRQRSRDRQTLPLQSGNRGYVAAYSCLNIWFGCLPFFFFFIPLSGFQGKRRHRRQWSSIRLKKRKLNGDGELEQGDGNHGEQEERNSEESCKSEENPIEDACSHCGLPNHPELVRMEVYI